jgi:ubiquinone/menaquinone biosynthesis C-methylase UbiE
MSIKNYLKMQKNHYQSEASRWSLQNKNPVVGGYDKHNAWADYDNYLFKDLDTKELIALDYGTGPGRNIIKFNDRFKRIDGVDISQKNIDNAKINLNAVGIKTDYKLFVCDGKSTPCEDETYDVWFSVICLQHIASYSIRFGILKDAYRILKPNGYICFQMGYGGRDENSHNYQVYKRNNSIITADYYADDYDAQTTNGFHDVSIGHESQIIGDLEKIGFKDIRFDLRPTGPGDTHKQWIFVQGKK